MFIILFFGIILNVKIILNNLIVIPFKEYIEDYNEIDTKRSISKILLDNYLDYKIYTDIKIGTPPKRLPVFINSNIKIFRAKIDENMPNFDFSKYDKYKPLDSLSFLNITQILNLEEFYFLGYSLINETLKFCKIKNCKDELEIKNIQLYTETKKNILSIDYSYSFLEIGIPLSKSTNEQTNVLIDLKNSGAINSSIITIEYENNNEGYIYIGEYPHIFNKNKFNNNDLFTAYTIPNYGINNQIKLNMDKIYIMKEENYLENNIIIFNYGLGIILSTEEYFNNILEIFFNKYINLNICKINIEKRNFNNNYHVVSCNKREEFKIYEFPSLYLFKEEFNFIFELNYKDLFKEIGNQYYFLIVYFPFSNTNFELGKPFLKKYQLSYNVDMSTIHFYQKNDENKKKIKINNGEKNIIYLIYLMILVVLLSIIFYKKIYHNKRKLRKNELNEDFNYSVPIDDIN